MHIVLDTKSIAVSIVAAKIARTVKTASNAVKQTKKQIRQSMIAAKKTKR